MRGRFEYEGEIKYSRKPFCKGPRGTVLPWNSNILLFGTVQAGRGMWTVSILSGKLSLFETNFDSWTKRVHRYCSSLRLYEIS